MTMAFITEDSMYCNKTSISGEEIENMNLVNAVKTFLSAKEDTVITSVDAPENIENLRKVTRNILDDFSIVAKQNETHCLPAPSNKEPVRVFLRVKPKTLEESKYRPPSVKKNCGPLDSEVHKLLLLTYNFGIFISHIILTESLICFNHTGNGRRRIYVTLQCRGRRFKF